MRNLGFALASSLALLTPSSFAQEAAPEPTPYAETVAVELLTVPFYAVDRDGAPVYDLRPEELELRVAGAPVRIDFFDRYAPATGTVVAAPGAETVSGPTSGKLLTPTTNRHVLLLVDLAFSTPAGLNRDKQAVERLLASLPANDQLYLLVYRAKEGLKQLVGPLAADAEGKAQVLALTRALVPSPHRLNLRADLDKIAEGKRFGSDNVEDAYRDAHGLEQTNYAAEARSQADAFEVMASFVRQLKGPKLLLLMSQGIDSGLYTQGVSEEFRNRVPALRSHFEGALRALAASGAMPLFVNADLVVGAGIDESTQFELDGEANAYLNSISRGETTLQEMAEVSGGIVIAHTNVEHLAQRIVDWTSAYYEIGFYLEDPAQREAIRLTVKRPGVEVWTPKGSTARRRYDELNGREKRFLIADLVLRGPNAEAGKDVVLSRFARLEGDFAKAEGKLGFAPAWPRELALKSVEVYSVVLALEGDAGAEPAASRVKLERFAGGVQALSPTGAAAQNPIEIQAPEQGERIWGIVAVDPDTSAVYLRRMRLGPDATPGGATGRGR